MSTELQPVLWREDDPARWAEEQAAMQRIAPDLTWDETAGSGGWRGPVPVWPFDRPQPPGVDHLLAGRRFEVRIICGHAHPMVEPVVYPMSVRPKAEALGWTRWHLGPDGRLCLLQTAHAWDSAQPVADSIPRISGWFIEYRLMQLGLIKEMPPYGLAGDASLDTLLAAADLPGGDDVEWKGGFDCSGLTHAAYDAAGIQLPRTADTQYRAGPLVPAGQPPQPGDLLFYGNPASRIHHVGLYIGDSQMIHAPTYNAAAGAQIKFPPVPVPGAQYIGGIMLRRVFTGVVAVVALLLIGGPAFAAPPETNTTTQKNLVETFVDVVPSCEGGGPAYTITTTSNLIEHETVFDDGRAHFTFTQTGTFVAVPLEDPSLPSYTGSFTIWGGFNNNGKAVNGTFTFTVRGTGSDGSRFVTHVTDHFNTTPTGAEFFFTRCHD